MLIQLYSTIRGKWKNTIKSYQRSTTSFFCAVVYGTAYLSPAALIILTNQSHAETSQSKPIEARVQVKSISISFTETNLGHNLNLKAIKAKIATLRSELPPKVTFKELESIADGVTAYMRKLGYKFHYAYLPPQKIQNRNVNLRIAEISLGDVHLQNSSSVSDKTIKSQFKELIDKPIYQPNINAAIKKLQQINSIRVFAYYSKGSKNQSMRLNLRVKNRKLPKFNFAIDNLGKASTGDIRVSTSGAWKNPLKRGDNLSFSITAADGEKTNVSGFISYRSPLWNLSNYFQVAISNNIFGIGDEFKDLDIEGDAASFRFAYEHLLPSSRYFSHRVILALETKENDVSSIFNDPDFEADENADIWKLSWNASLVTKSYTLHNFELGLTQGSFNIDGQTEDKETFYKLTPSYSLIINANKQSHFNTHFKLAFRGQYSDKRLSSFERMVLSGPYGARSIEGGVLSGDTGALLTAQFSYPKILSKVTTGLTPYWFVDQAWAEQYELDGTTRSSGSITSLGIGFDWNIKKHVILNFSGATTLDSKSDQELDGGINIDDEKSSQVSLQLHLRW